MRFLIENSFTTVEGTTSEIKYIDDVLSVREKGFRFAKAFRAGFWDGYTHLLKNKKFRTGLLPYCVRMCAKRELDVELVDKRKNDPKIRKRISLSLPPNITEIRDFQKQSITELLKRKETGVPFQRGIIEVGTGGGKTLIIALICSKLMQKTLIIVNSIDLLQQTSEDLKNFLGEEIGIIGSGRDEQHCRVTVSTVQTLSRNIEAFLPLLKSIETLIIDECHHTSAKSFIDVADMCINASVRVGLSGTPFKDNNPLHIQQLRSVLGDPLIVVSSSRLIQDGIVAPVTILYVPIDRPKTITRVVNSTKENYKVSTLPYREVMFEGKLECPGAYEELIVRNEYRNSLFCSWVKSRKKPTLVIVDRIEHGEIVQKILDCPFLKGAESAETRKQALEDVRTGKLKTLIATPIFDEGVNAPAIKYLALLSGGKAPGRLKQRIGRGMRKTGEELVVLDSLDLTHSILAKHSKERIKTCVKAGFKIKRVDPNELQRTT